ncbi:MAG: GNAT family N-acetyltransferase [Gammaproteobacteria bacterium]|nr:GNAT family N-acetyltransferase [Gammaproteobacteria bacterium]
MLKSKNLILKAPSQNDYESFRKVRPCDEFYFMVGGNPAESIFFNDKKFDESFSELLTRENYWFACKGVEISEIIGAAFLHSIDTSDKRARYAVGIYNEENWNNGYGQEITQTILRYAFHDLKLHKVDLRVLAYNKRAIASYKKSGFVQEGMLRENAFINNEWHDDIIMGILSHEFHEK